MKNLVPLLFGLLSCLSMSAQSNKKVFIQRVRSPNASAIKFKLDVNNQSYQLKNGDTLTLSLPGDSLHISLLNKGLKRYSREVHQPLTDETFIIIYAATNGKFGKSRDSVFIQAVCKECYFNSLKASRRN